MVMKAWAKTRSSSEAAVMWGTPRASRWTVHLRSEAGDGQGAIELREVFAGGVTQVEAGAEEGYDGEDDEAW